MTTTLLNFARPEDVVQRYDSHTKELKSTQKDKALKFLKYGCIQYLKDIPEDLKKLYPDQKNAFVCLPLNTAEAWNFFGRTFRKEPFCRDFNSTTYIISKSAKYPQTFECDCQGWQTRHRKGEIVVGGYNCSHVGALFLAFHLRLFGQSHQEASS
jgi:hypothetical protein